MELIINTDGASRGNPGPAAYAFVIREKETKAILHQEGEYIGTDTNNVAEYTAVLKSCEYIKKYFQSRLPLKIEILTDSQLIARQLAGLYKIKNQNLKKIYNQIKILEFDLGTVVYTSIPREQNYIADKVANQALDKRLYAS